MKETLKYALAIGITAAAMFAYMYEAPPRQVGQELAKTAPALTNEATPAKSAEQASKPHQAPPQRELSPAELADIDPASIDWEAMKERYRDVTFGEDPMLAAYSIFIKDFKPEEIAAYNRLHVIPFNPTVGEECSPLLLGGTEDFPQHTQMNCVPVLEREEHHYRNLSLEELFDLVETNNDAEAAAIASQHFQMKEQDRLGLAIRAATLSGKSGPILKVSRSYRPNIGSNPTTESIVETVAQFLVLENIAALMGDPRAKPDNPVSLTSLEEAGLDQDEIKTLREYIKTSADETLRRMGEVQRELTGATSILELTNA